MGVRRGLGALALMLGLTAAGCSAVGGDPDVEVEGTWLLVSGRTVDGPLDVADARVSLSFDGELAGGKAPCNDYGSEYGVDGAAFALTGDGMSMTLAGCGEAPEALESAYLSVFQGADTVARDGDTLTLSGGGAEVVFTATPPWPRSEVVGHTWWLRAYTDETGTARRPTWQSGRRPFVRLDESGPHGGRITASTGCRRMTGRWREWQGAPTITRSAWTGGCGPVPSDQEITVGNVLGEPVLGVRERDRRTELVLRYAHGGGPAELVYRR